MWLMYDNSYTLANIQIVFIDKLFVKELQLLILH